MLYTGGAICVLKGAAVGGAGEAWYVAAVLLALVAFIQRLLSSRVLLGSTTLTVVNPVFTYSCPRESVRWASVRDDGGLEIHLRDGHVVDVFAFGGSLISRVVGSGPKAAGEIWGWLNGAREGTGDGADIPRRAWTRTPFPELVSALAALFVGVGLVLRVIA